MIPLRHALCICSTKGHRLFDIPRRHSHSFWVHSVWIDMPGRGRGCGRRLRLPRFGGASYAIEFNNRSRYRQVGLSSAGVDAAADIPVGASNDRYPGLDRTSQSSDQD